MVGRHHGLNGFEFEQTLGYSEGQGSLVFCSPGVAKSWTWLSDWTTTTHIWTKSLSIFKALLTIVKFLPWWGPRATSLGPRYTRNLPVLRFSSTSGHPPKGLLVWAGGTRPEGSSGCAAQPPTAQGSGAPHTPTTWSQSRPPPSSAEAYLPSLAPQDARAATPHVHTWIWSPSHWNAINPGSVLMTTSPSTNCSPRPQNTARQDTCHPRERSRWARYLGRSTGSTWVRAEGTALLRGSGSFGQPVGWGLDPAGAMGLLLMVTSPMECRTGHKAAMGLCSAGAGPDLTEDQPGAMALGPRASAGWAEPWPQSLASA